MEEKTVLDKRIDALISEWKANLLEPKNGAVNKYVDYRMTGGFKIVVGDKVRAADIWKIVVSKLAEDGDTEQIALKDSSRMRLRSMPGTTVLDWCGMTSQTKDIDKLTELKDKSEKVRKEKGINPLYCCFGLVKWRITASDGANNALTSPLVMVPVRLVTQGQSPVYIKILEDEAFVNPAFLYKFRTLCDSHFPVPAETGEVIDAGRFDLDGYFAEVAEYMEDIGGDGAYTFDADWVAVDEFDYSRLCMYRDLRNNVEKIRQNKLIRALAGDESAKIFHSDYDKIDVDKAGVNEVRQVLPCDGIQFRMTELVRRGDSFVMQGPPGTGKSQTIVNMIASLLEQGKRVLFVSERLTALTEVYNKIKAMTFENGEPCDLHKYCMLVDSDSESLNLNVSRMKEILRESYEIKPVTERQMTEFRIASDACASKLSAVRSAAETYQKLMYDKSLNSLGMSVYDLVGRISSLGNYDYFRFDVPSLSRLTAADLTVMEEAAQTLEKHFVEMDKWGGHKGHVWYGYNLDEISDETADYVRRASEETRRVLDALDKAFSADGCEKVKDILNAQKLSVLLKFVSPDFRKNAAAYFLFGETLLKSRIKETEEEKERSALYRPALQKLRSSVDKDVFSLDYCRAEALLQGKNGDINVGQMQSLYDLYKLFSEGWIKERAFDGDGISKLKVALNDCLAAEKEKTEIKDKIDEQFDADFYNLDIDTDLLVRFRTDLAPAFQRTGKEKLFTAKYRKAIMRYCKNNYKALNSVEALAAVNLLNSFREADKKFEKAKGVLGGYGITYFTEAQLKAFADEITAFDRYLAENRILLSEKPDAFSRFLKRKCAETEEVCAAARELGVKERNVTVAELSALAQAAAVVKSHKDRLDNCDYSYVFGYDGLDTDWDVVCDNLSAVAELKKLQRAVDKALNRGERAVQDNADFFDKLTTDLGEGGMYVKIKAAVAVCEKFYSQKWFGKKKYDYSAVTLGDMERWSAAACNIENLRNYISFMRDVRAVKDTYFGRYIDLYAERMRSEYPYGKFADNFVRSVLYMYYCDFLSSLGQDEELFWIAAAEERVKRFAETDEKNYALNRRYISNKLSASVDRSPTSNRYRFLNSSYPSCRALFRSEGESIQSLKPCMMMSTSSVAQLLDTDSFRFDAVIFDEASQIATENAIGALMRGNCFVIAGDRNQMPVPVYFAERNAASEALSEGGKEDDGSVIITSVIDFALHTRGTCLFELQTHFRSKHESLIKFSNDFIYDRKLITFPSPHPADADFGLVSVHISDADCPSQSGGVNLAEAEKAAQLISAHWRKHGVPTEEQITAGNFKSLGVITFGQAQRDAVIRELNKNADDRRTAANLMRNEKVFFVKTIDDVQGNEMDVIIISLTYGRDSEGKPTNNFAPLSVSKLDIGLHKFNVAVTRAKECLKFIWSVDTAALNDRCPKFLREYFILLSRAEKGAAREFAKGSPDSDFITAVGRYAESIVGKDRVVYNYGMTDRSYKVPVVILNKARTDIALGLLCEKYRGDGIALREKTYVYDKFLTGAFKWNAYKVYAYEWCANPQYKIDLKEKLQQVLNI